jgi:two-component system LytT family response regulator
LDLLRKVEMFDFRVIFLSGHDDYYQQAMHLAAVTFVYKPFDLSDLVIAIEKVFNDISEDEDQKKMEILLSNADQPVSSQTVVFPDVNNGYAVPLSSILYGEAVAGGCIMHLEEEKDIFVPRPLRRYEQMFSDYAFYRCHPLFVVNLQKVEHLEASTHSLILRGGIEIPLGEGKYEQVKLRFSQSGLKTGLK